MKASKFTESQIAFVLKQGEEGTPVAEVCRKAGISQATYFNWKKKFGGLLPVLLRREGWLINEKCAPAVSGDGPAITAQNTEAPREGEAGTTGRRPWDEVWAMDFVHDRTAMGTKIRILTIVDTFSRFSPAVEPRFRFRGSDVVETLERVGKCYGLPKVIRVDQGSEFVSRDLDLWAYQRGVTLDFSRPGKPTDNAFIESFNGKLRTECLNAHWFMCLVDAQEKSEAWRRDCNEVRPHSAIGNKPPIALVERSAAHGPLRPEQAGNSSSG